MVPRSSSHGLPLVAAVLVLGACSARRAAPSDWHKALDASGLSAGCEELLGAMDPGNEPSPDRLAIIADVKASDLPVEIRRLRPRQVTTSLVDVDIQLGTYEHPSGERDYWGVVCSKGSFRNAFLQGDGTTFLRQLHEHLWYYDGVM